MRLSIYVLLTMAADSFGGEDCSETLWRQRRLEMRETPSPDALSSLRYLSHLHVQGISTHWNWIQGVAWSSTETHRMDFCFELEYLQCVEIRKSKDNYDSISTNASNQSQSIVYCCHSRNSYEYRVIFDVIVDMQRMHRSLNNSLLQCLDWIIIDYNIIIIHRKYPKCLQRSGSLATTDYFARVLPI